MSEMKLNAVPNPVGFLLDRSELEILAVHYFAVSLEIAYDQFADPGEPVPTSEWYEDRIASQRLDDIAAVLGDEKMNELTKRAQADFRKRNPKITDEDWADFNGPIFKGETTNDKLKQAMKDSMAAIGAGKFQEVLRQNLSDALGTPVKFAHEVSGKKETL